MEDYRKIQRKKENNKETKIDLKKRKKANKKIKLNKIKGEKIQSKGTLFNHGHGVTKTGECLF
jgi:hypothetical protein